MLRKGPTRTWSRLGQVRTGHLTHGRAGLAPVQPTTVTGRSQISFSSLDPGLVRIGCHARRRLRLPVLQPLQGDSNHAGCTQCCSATQCVLPGTALRGAYLTPWPRLQFTAGWSEPAPRWRTGARRCCWRRCSCLLQPPPRAATGSDAEIEMPRAIRAISATFLSIRRLSRTGTTQSQTIIDSTRDEH